MEEKENKMGYMPVSKLLISMSLPIMISMLVQALYNIVDSIFVAQLGEDALTAVSLAFPVQSIMISVAVGTAVGLNSLISRKLGQKRKDEANLAASHGLLLGILSYFVFALFGIFGSRMYFEAFSNNPVVIDMGVQYISICTIFSFGIFLQVISERIMQSAGITIYNMVTQLVGAVTNIILDPIMIFGLFGMPKFGIAGAAMATVIGQIVAMLLSLLLNHLKNHEVRIAIKDFKLNGYLIGEIYRVGAPSIVMQSIGSIMTMGLNVILASSQAAISVLGVYFKLNSFIFMPVFGLTNGLIPICAYNFGAKKKDRILLAVKDALIYAAIILTIGMGIFLAIPDKLLMMFNASSEMLRIGVPALRFISLSFPLAAVGIVLSSLYQALGEGMYSLIMSVCRQLLVILPLAYILNKLFGMTMLWASFAFAEVISLFICLYLYKRCYKKHLVEIDPKAA
ncbi:MATE family efflux transporter [Beduini massiliensis]|uniref:MATE family efflux transporter n=1 Tax=Beduini massiliensis TaxID=1585974 RepID=UPI000B052660|nr:MATE family efflux transporter [Beduini massiliensis]